MTNDHKNNKTILFPFILMLIGLLSIAFKVGQSTPIVSLNTANIIRILSVGTAAVISAIYFFSGKSFFSIFKVPFVYFFLFSVIAILSSSYASVSFYSIWKALEILIGVASVAVVLTHYNSKNNLKTLYEILIKYYILLLITVLIGAFISPQDAFTYSRGIFNFQLRGYIVPLNANSVAFMSAFCGLVFFIKIINRSERNCGIIDYIIFSASLVILILAQSRTSLVGFIISLLIYMIFSRRYKLLISIFIILMILSSISILKEGAVNYVVRGQSKELAMSLSGRTVAWESGWKLFLKSPYIGNGFGSASRYDVLKGGTMSTMHGSIIEVLVGVGVVGFVPWLFGVIGALYRLIWPKNRIKERSTAEVIFRSELIAVAVLIIIRSVTSSVLANYETPFLLFMILAAYSSLPENDASTE